MKAETERELMATQDQVLQTATEGKCQQQDVTIVRILSACSALVKNMYQATWWVVLNYNLIYASKQG